MLAEAARAKMDINPMPGEDIDALLRELYAMPADVVAKERSIAAARAAESGKPANIVEKMIEGAVAKYVAEVTLLAQPFVKGDGKQTVGDLVKAQGADINGFVLFVVGEGIEKRKDDFAGEVAAMTRPKNGNGSGAAATA